MNDDDLDAELARRIRASLAHIGTDTPHVLPRRRRRPAAVVLKAAAAIVVLAAIVTVAVTVAGGGDSASAVTPGLLRFDAVDTTAGELLEQAAVSALATGADTDGDVAYTLTETWVLDTVVGEDLAAQVSLDTTVTETWVDTDGQARVTVRAGRTLEPGEVGGVFVAPDTSTEPRLDYTESAFNADLARLVPDDPVAIVDSATLGIGGDDADLLQTIVGMLAREPLTASQRAALWRSLAAIDALEVLGSTTDRLGRDGVAVAVTSTASGIETRWLTVFDPDDGSVLALEAILTGDSRALDIPTPALAEYHLYVQSAGVADLGERPPG